MKRDACAGHTCRSVPALGRGLIACAGLASALVTGPGSAFAASGLSTDACATERIVDVSFDNGAAWTFCWSTRLRTGLVIESASYIAPGGEPYGVLASGSLAQLHVAYDDSNITYSDVTQYGLGGTWLQALDESDCEGYRIAADARDVLCMERRDAGGPDERLTLFSVSQIGSYAYIISWSFHADGTLAPGIGASGALQRRSDDTTLPFGRVLAVDPESLWLSHTHNYYWRLDVDLGARGSDDVVVLSDYRTLEDGRRARHDATLSIETAARMDRSGMQIWHLRDQQATRTGYRLDVPGAGHAFQRPQIEDWASDDLFVTVQRDCERFASQNTRFEPGCADDVADYVDGESLGGADLVLWQRIAFHHVPRNEDRRHMHTHWDGFALRPIGGTVASTGSLAPRDDVLPSRRSGGGSAASSLIAVLLVVVFRRRYAQRFRQGTVHLRRTHPAP